MVLHHGSGFREVYARCIYHFLPRNLSYIARAAGEIAAQAPSSDNALFFFTVVKHIKTKPDTDWDAVAAELGYSNANTARVGSDL